MTSDTGERNRATGELTVGQLGEQAGQAVRALNHRTRPGVHALTDPAEVCAVVAELACLAGRLPQLLGQLSGWLGSQQRAGRLRVDAGSPQPDVAAAVAAAVDCLTRAGEGAHHTGAVLDAAHTILAHLAGTATARDDQDPG